MKDSSAVYSCPKIGTIALPKSGKQKVVTNSVNTVYQIQNAPAEPHKFVLNWFHYLVLMRMEAQVLD